MFILDTYWSFKELRALLHLPYFLVLKVPVWSISLKLKEGFGKGVIPHNLRGNNDFKKSLYLLLRGGVLKYRTEGNSFKSQFR